MSHLGDVVWLEHDSLADAMGEFAVEDEQVTRPMPSSLFQRVAAASRIALPQAPPAGEPCAPPAGQAAPAPAASPEARPAPPTVSPAAQRGRWFVGAAAMALLALAQAPF